MSRLGTEFLYNWIKQRLTDADRGGDSTRAMALADKCREAAAAQGLPVDDEPEWGNLESIIYSKIYPLQQWISEVCKAKARLAE